MGTNFKKSIFDEHIQVGLVGWAQKVKKKTALKMATNSAGQESSTDGPAVGIQLGSFMRKQPNPEEVQPSNGSQP